MLESKWKSENSKSVSTDTKKLKSRRDKNDNATFWKITTGKFKYSKEKDYYKQTIANRKTPDKDKYIWYFDVYPKWLTRSTKTSIIVICHTLVVYFHRSAPILHF